MKRPSERQIKNLKAYLADLRMKVISPSRALVIAKNNFLKGDLKKLNAEKRKYEKAAKKFDSDFNSYEEEKFIFDNTNWEKQAEKIQQSYYLAKTKIKLGQQQEEIKKWKKNLDDETKRWKIFAYPMRQNKKWQLLPHRFFVKIFQLLKT